MLRVASKKPAVIITKDKYVASCPNENCTYEILDEDVPEVTKITIDNTEITIDLKESGKYKSFT